MLHISLVQILVYIVTVDIDDRMFLKGFDVNTRLKDIEIRLQCVRQRQVF